MISLIVRLCRFGLFAFAVGPLAVHAFGGLEAFPPFHLIHDASMAAVTLGKTSLHEAQSFITATTITKTSMHSSTPVATSIGASLLQPYKQLLATHPLATKMATGGTLAVMGDAIAQSRGADADEEYDVRRAASFGAFDMCYRALQHVSFPVIVNHCHGQFLGGLASLIMLFPGSQSLIHGGPTGDQLAYYAAAMEQTLASQLGIVPFLYYPVFFALTGFMQGLTMEGSVIRARENFLPLMQRNLLFWIPVQFVQFGFVEEGLQIPFLSLCGLAWTFILSLAAGSTKTYSKEATSSVDRAPESEMTAVAVENFVQNEPTMILPILSIEKDEKSKEIVEIDVAELVANQMQ